MRTATNIPVSLCEYALINRKVNQLKLYLYLKLNCDGYTAFGESDMVVCSKQLGINIKTVKTSLGWLIKNKWITINSRKKVMHVIGYNNLERKLQVKIKTGVLIDLMTDDDYKNLKALCCAIVVTYYLRRKRYFDGRSERKFGGSITNRNKGACFYPMANSYLAKCLNVSVSTAYRIKQEAETAGYITTKGNYQYMESINGEKISSVYFDIVRSQSIKEGHIDVYRKGVKYIKLVDADLIKSHITCKRRGY